MLNRLVYKQLSNLILYLYSEIDEDGRINTNKDLQTSKHYKIINNVDPFCYRPFVLKKSKKNQTHNKSGQTSSKQDKQSDYVTYPSWDGKHKKKTQL